MTEFFIWLALLSLIILPVVSVIYLYISWNRFRAAVPFTPERDKQKVRLIIAAVIAGIVLSIFIAAMAIYGVKVFFAP